MKLYLTETPNLTIDQIIQFNKLALELRSEYNRIIGDMSHGRESNEDWWASEIAGRNTNTSTIFRDLSYLYFAIWLIKNKNSPAEIVVDQISLYKTLKKYFRKHSLKIKLTNIEGTWDKAYRIFGPIYHFFLNTIRFFNRHWAAVKTNKNKTFIGDAKITLVDSFIIKGSFNERKYIDGYYNDFGNTLSDKQNSSIFLSPTFINFNKFKNIFKKVRASKKQFILKEDYLKKRDYFYALFYSIRALKLKPRNIFMYDMDVTPVFTSLWYKNLTSISSYEGLLKIRFAQRLKENGVKIRLILDWFENQIIDKCFNLGFSKAYPQVKRIGYQVVFDSKFYNCFFPTENEQYCNILPNKIYTPSKIFSESIKEFCPNLKTGVAPAFRYSHVWKKRKATPDQSFYTIMLTLTGVKQYRNDVLGLVKDIISHINIDKNIRFWIKLHPVDCIDEVKRDFKREWPKCFDVKTGNISELIEQTDLIISSNSTTSLEALAKGVPVIIVGSLSGLTQNPVPDTISNKICKVAYTKKQILDAIYEFESAKNTNIDFFESLGDEIRQDYFKKTDKYSVIDFLEF
jgi:hypothetical protein